MIPIIVFALAAQGSDISDGIITAGVMLRGLVLINVLKLSSYLESKSKIMGGYVLLPLLIIFFLTLIILTLLFYSTEHIDNSKITTMGDALWWTIQTTSTATFGPNPATEVGRMVGAIIMFIGIGSTTTFISILAAGLTKTRIRCTSNDESDPEQILKVRLAKSEITKEVFLDLKKLISSKASIS